MKFFNMVHFTKEGKDIDKDEPPKAPFFRFWELVWRKKYKLINLNLLYFAFNILAIALAAILIYTGMSFYCTLSNIEINSIFGSAISTDLFFIFMLFFVVLLTVIPVFAIGPFQAGFTYILKSYVLEQPVFLWSDFTTKARSNKKLSIKVTVTNIIVACLLFTDIAFFAAISIDKQQAFTGIPNWILFVAALVTIFVSALLIMINMYTYPMMVIFNITYRQLYKNSFILSLVRWLPNLGILLIDVLIIGLPLFLIPSLTNAYVTVILYLFITPAFVGFINNFYVYSVIKKFMIDNPNADKSGNNPSDESVINEINNKASGEFIDGRFVSSSDSDLNENTNDKF